MDDRRVQLFIDSVRIIPVKSLEIRGNHCVCYTGLNS